MKFSLLYVVIAICLFPGTTIAQGTLVQAKKVKQVSCVLQNGHVKGIYLLIFSPDGKSLLSGAADGLKLWDVESGFLIRTYEGKNCPGGPLCFSPDGRMIIGCSSDNRIRAWDVLGSGIKTNEFHTSSGLDRMLSMAFSPDRKFVVGLSDQEIDFWDSINGKLISKFPAPKNSAFKSFAYDSNGKFMVCGNKDDRGRIWCMTNEKLLEIAKSGKEPFVNFSISPDNRHFLVESRIYKARPNDRSMQDPFYKISMLDLQKRIFTQSVTLDYSAHHIPITPMFDLAGESIFLGLETGIQVWNPTNFSIDPVKLQGFQGYINCFAFNPNGTLLATGANKEGGLQINYLKDQSVKWKTGGHSINFGAITISPDGKYFANCSGKSTIWDIMTGRPDEKPNHLSWSSRFSSDWTTYTSNGFGSQSIIKVFERKTSALLDKIIGYDNSRVQDISPDGKKIAFLDHLSSYVTIWDIEKRAWAWQCSKSMNYIYFAAFSPDGKQVVLQDRGGRTNILKIFDSAQGVLLRQFNIDIGYIPLFAFSPDGKMFVSHCPDGKLGIYNSVSGSIVRNLQNSSESYVSIPKSADFSPSGKLIAIGGYGLVSIWDASSGSLLMTLPYQMSSVEHIKFSMDGKFVFVTLDDTSLKIWRLSDKKSLTLYSFDTGDWYVLHPNGRYDRSDGGSKFIKYVDGMTVYDTERFDANFRTPGLLAKFMRGEEIPEGKPVFDTVRKIFIAPGADDWLKELH